MFAIYGRTCWLCGHDGSTDADHLVPISVDSAQPVDPQGMRPAHGVRGCPTCGVKCNQVKGNKLDLPRLVTSEDW
jgi:5-methylcytosine-specific restriction endonuclease McrA